MKPLKVVSFFLILTFYSCEKEFTKLGNQIKPQSENFYVGYVDSTSFKAYTLLDDSVKINNNSVNLLGSYNDPIFGTNTSGFLTQFALLQTNITFPDTVDADSLVLNLYYTGFYRNSDDEYQIDLHEKSMPWISIYKLNSDLALDTSYYSDFNVENYYSEDDLLVNTYLTPSRSNYFNFTLPHWLADSLLNADSLNYVDNSAFQNYFKGLYLKVSQMDEGGTVYYIDLDNSKSSLSLYYRHETDTVSTEFNFGINTTCAKVNLFNHNYENANIIGIGDTISQDSVIYLQSMSGLKSRIEIPYLNSWYDSINISGSSNIIINKAELTFYVQDEGTYSDQYAALSKLILKAINEDGSELFIPELWETTQTGYTYEGAIYDAEIKGYTFNIAKYFQSLITPETKDIGFYLLPASSSTNARRVVLKSGLNSNPISLKITYSKI